MHVCVHRACMSISRSICQKDREPSGLPFEASHLPLSRVLGRRRLEAVHEGRVQEVDDSDAIQHPFKAKLLNESARQCRTCGKEEKRLRGLTYVCIFGLIFGTRLILT